MWTGSTRRRDGSSVREAGQLASLAAVRVPPDGSEVVEVLFGLAEASLCVLERLLGSSSLVDEATDVEAHVGRLRAEPVDQLASLVPEVLERRGWLGVEVVEREVLRAAATDGRSEAVEWIGLLLVGVAFVAPMVLACGVEVVAVPAA